MELAGLLLLLLLLMVALLHHSRAGEGQDVSGEIKVVKLQESMVANTGSFAKWTGHIPGPVTAVTICYRVKMYYYRPDVTVFSYINTNNTKIRTDHNRYGMQVVVASHDRRLDTGFITPLLQWSAFCIALSNTSPDTIYFNGLKYQGEDGLDGGGFRDTPFMDVDGTIVLGQDQDAPAAVYDSTQSFSGEVTDVNVWSRHLSQQEMVNITSCKTRLQGDVLAWDSAQFEIGTDSSETTLPLTETCNIVPEPYFMFLDKLQFLDAVRLCRAFGGELTTPRDDLQQKAVYTLAESNRRVCGEEGGPLMWLGITDQHSEGNWRYISTNTNVSYFNWAQGQPNGRTMENCAVIKGETFKGRWVDQSCRKSLKVCTLCTLNTPVILRFRGICDSTLYDELFVLAGTMNGKPYFRGYYRSHVFYSERRWHLHNIMANDTHGLMDDDGSLDFPVGRHDWRFSHGFCGEEQGVAQSLTLTQCAQNRHFTCDDGTCIPINQVCDRRVQCPDMSDELDCSTVQLPKGYQPTLPPPSTQPDLPLPVYLNITLNTFASIKAIDNRFTVELLVRLVWRDPRLQFRHLRRDRQLNIILPSEAEKMWVPVVAFLNAEKNQHTVVDTDTKITIERLGAALADHTEISKEARVYEGSDNNIRVARKYTVVFQCSFNFFYYPFNTDYCYMIFRMNTNTDKYVALWKDGAGIHYRRKDKLAEYTIGKVIMRRLVTDEPYSGLQAIVQMKRLYTTQVVTVFIPTTLINVISFATFLFKWFDFQNRIMVSLTALLVLSMLFSQISDNLPKTSYVKLIDIWFFSSIMFSFLTVLLHTVVEYNHHYSSPTAPSSSPCLLETGEPASKDSTHNWISVENPAHPYSRPVLINKIGFLVTITVYAMIFVIFWIVALNQKTPEDAMMFSVNDTQVTSLG
nr:uncharacterized protein LOC123756697 isoform X1 [Procambarus clarkii]